MKHALAVTVEPFKFSSRQGGVAYELSYKKSTSAISHRGVGYSLRAGGCDSSEVGGESKSKE